MKRSNLSTLIGASAIGMSLAILPLVPVSAQTDTTPGITTTEPVQGINNVEQGDRDFDWGWLGLIGLAGLAGLSGKKEAPTVYRDPDVANTTPGYRE